MTVTLLPNVEAIVSKFLAAQPEVTALLSTRIYTALPKDVGYPAARVTQFDDLKITQRPLWVARGSLQIEVWGGTKAQAYTAAATAQAVIAERIEGVHADGVVTGVTFGAMRDFPDDTFSPAKPRWIFTVFPTVHPA